MGNYVIMIVQIINKSVYCRHFVYCLILESGTRRKSGVSGRRRWGRCDWSHGDWKEPMREERVSSTPGKRGVRGLFAGTNTTQYSPFDVNPLLRPINFQNNTRALFSFVKNNHYYCIILCFKQK